MENNQTNQSNYKRTMRIIAKVALNLLIIFFIIGIFGISFTGAIGAGYFASLLKDEPIRKHSEMKKDIYNYEETSLIYFSDNIFLGKLRSDLERDEIKLNEVSQYVRDAVVATEDQNFYEHQGVVPKAIARAILQEFTNSSIKTGGSTLTQQLIKNQILTNEVSFERKAKEIMLALRLERFFEKDEILEAYLNVVPFGRNSSGRNIAGIQTAAQGIFGKNASELNLAQSAYIAGLPQSPFGYTPFTKDGQVKDNIDSSLERMKTVLNRMKETGKITESQYSEALNYDIRADFAAPKKTPIQQYPYLTFEVEKRAIEIISEILAKQDGYTEDDFENNEKLKSEYLIKAERDIRKKGYKIHTTIDKKIYDRMQEVKNQYNYYGSDKPETVIDQKTGKPKRVLEPVEVGAVLIENNTGKIISFVGGRNFEREQINHATTAKRSNGSTMKPLLVYAPAMELGIAQPGTVIADVDMAIRTGSSIWKPKNYGGGYHGLVSARNALARSYNIPAAKVYTKTVNQNPTSFLKDMGFTSLTKGDESHLSMALGGLEKGVTVEENVNAYATFANNGNFIDAYLIDRIESQDGELIYKHQPKPVKVFSEQTAYLMIDMMRDVISSGTASGVQSRLKFRSDWAGKTGTSQDFKDAWFVATNPNVTFGTWIGYDTPKPLEQSYKGISYSQRNIRVWAELINSAYELKPDLINPKENFKSPGGIVSRSYCALSGMLPSDLCKSAGLVKSDIFNAKFVPKKPDNSLEQANYVTINGKIYRADSSTPNDFVKSGIMITKDFFKSHELENLKDAQSLIPKNESWGNILSPEIAEATENGKVPGIITNVKLSNTTISWSPHPEGDIVGYRIYKAPNTSAQFTKVGTIVGSDSLAYTISDPSALYYITAVDIKGKESAPSQFLTINGNNSIVDDVPTNNEIPIDQGENSGSEAPTALLPKKKR